MKGKKKKGEWGTGKTCHFCMYDQLQFWTGISRVCSYFNCSHSHELQGIIKALCIFLGFIDAASVGENGV